MQGSSSPKFLHQSYEHETVIEPCRLTSITVVRAPAREKNVPTVSSTTTTRARSTRWLVWVDKRRGLLGRTAIACPTPADPPPGRRQSLPSSSKPQQVPLHDGGMGANGRVGRSSLPLLAREEPGIATGRGPTQGDGDDERRPKDVSPADAKILPAGWTGNYRDSLSRVAPNDEQPSTGEPGSYNNTDVEEAGDAQILLRGLDRPSRVSAARGCKHGILGGVFFIDHTRVTGSNRRRSTIPVLAPESDLGSGNQATSRSGRVRFLEWGVGKQAVTLVERLCNPVALFVAQDSSVFVLEEVWQGSGSGFRDQDLRRTRHRVCRLDGTRLSRWLGSNINTGSKGVETVAVAISARRMNSRNRSSDGLRGRNEQEGGGGSPLLVSSAARDEQDVVTGDESETDWETSGSCASDHDINTEGEHALRGDLRTASAPDGHSRRRGVVDFIEVLAIPSFPVQDGDRPEQPVDFCMLADGTIVVAFCRSAPLHGGQSTAEAHGVVRAFRAKPREPTVMMDASGSPPAPVVLGTGRSVLSLKAGAPSSYSSSQGWLVAEELPVITGIAASGGSAVYVSLCGAGHDGTVHAVASLSTEGRTQSVGPSGVSMHAVARGSSRGADKGGGGGGTGTEAGGRAMRGRGWRVGAKGGNDRGVGGSGHLFVPIVSGVAAALTVDGDRNLFYVTAENRGTCRALWCRLPGAGRRRVSSLLNLSPVVQQVAVKSSKTTSKPNAIPTRASNKEAAVATAAAVTSDILSVFVHPSTTEGGADEHDRRSRGAQLPTKAAAELKTEVGVAAKRAIALSVALTEEDDAISAGIRGGAKSLFTSRAPRAPGDGERRASGCEGTDNEGEEGEEEGDAPINIAVVSRCRPLLAREIKRGVRAAVFCEGNEVVVSGKDLPIDRSRRFEFDRVFGPGTGQARVYGEAVAPVVRKMLDGYNCSVLVYGQTGSGKTFTMEGGLSRLEQPASVDDTPTADTEKMGIIPRTVHTIFREGDGGGSRRYWVYVSHMEIYNERLFDLLAQEATSSPTAVSPSRSPKHRYPRSAGGCSPRSTAARSPRATSPVTATPQAASPREISRTAASPRPVSPSGKGVPQADRGMGRGHPSASDVDQDDSPGPSEGRGTGRDGDRTPTGKSRSPPRSPTIGLRGERSTSGAFERSAGRKGGWGAGGGGGGGSGVLGRGLTIEENPELGVMVKGLTQVEVESPEEIFGILAKSKNNRRTAETMCNVESSRSHGVFCVRVISAEPTPWGGEITRDGRLSLVDLSGSENIKRSGAVGARAKEAAAIGQSLLALGRVMKALVRRAPHVPYRESKLTRVLGDSLGGNAFTAIILNITPNHGMLDETLNTLAYAKTAQSVENTPKQHIANKSRTEAATTGKTTTTTTKTGLPPDEVLSCAIAKELRRWRGAAVNKVHSSKGPPARAHVSPWESKVPIRSPCLKIPSKHERQDQHSSSNSLLLSSSRRQLQHDRPGSTSQRSLTASRPFRDRCAVAGGDAGKKKRPVSVGGKLDGGARDKRTSTTLRDASRDGRRAFEPSSADDTSRQAFLARGSQSRSWSYLGSGGRGTHSSSSRRGTEAAADTNGVLYSGTSHQEEPRSRTGRNRTALESVSDSNSPAKCFSTLPGYYRRGSSSSAGPTDPVATKVFDSTAAEWIHSVVLERREVCDKQHASLKSGEKHGRHGESPIADQAGHKGSAVWPATTAEQRNKKKRRERSVVFGGGVHDPLVSSASVAAGTGLTMDAQRAINEIFDRYSTQADRGFLVSTEISALLEIWTRPEAEPPPPKSLPLVRRDSSCSSTSRSTLSPKNRSAVKANHTHRRLAGEPTPEAHEDNHSGRALTREAFLEFCRCAAFRDAIFARHFLMRSGYNLRLETPLATSTASAPPAAARKSFPAVSDEQLPMDDNTHTGVARPKTKISRVGVDSRRQKTRGETARRPSQQGDVGAGNSGHGNIYGGGGGGGGAVGAETLLRRSSNNSNSSTSINKTGVVETPGRLGVSPADRGAFEYRNDDDPRRMTTGGIVDPAELWDWTEDGRDHGERHKTGGLLSRGGGAHFSPALAATSATTTTVAGNFTTRARSMKAIGSGTAGEGYSSTPRSPRTNGHGIIVDGDVSGVVVVPSPLVIKNAAAEISTQSGSKGGEDTSEGGDRNLPHDGSKTPITSMNPPHSIALTENVRSVVAQNGSGSAVESACSVASNGVLREGLPKVGQVCEWCGVTVRPRALHKPTFCDED